MSYYRTQLENWLKTLDIKANRVLDIGGSQLPVRPRLKSWDVKEYKILDLEEPHEGKNKPDIVCDLNDFLISSIQEKNLTVFRPIIYPVLAMDDIIRYGEEENKFDSIFCLEVFEYIYNPVVALNNINFFMKEGATLFITFPFVYPMHNPVENDYLRYTKAGAMKLLEEAGFEVKEIIERTDRTGMLGTFYGADGMHCATGRDTTGFLIKAIKK